MSKVKQNKKEKENSLFDAGFSLISSQGIHATSIGQISKTDGVGKGTFYLYFKDKYDLMDRLIIRKSNEILLKALENTDVNLEDDLDKILTFVTNVMDLLQGEKITLKLIRKNLSWALLKRTKDEDNSIHLVYELFRKSYVNMGLEVARSNQDLYLILEIVGSLSYNAIVHEEPYTLEEIKPKVLECVTMIIKR